MKDEEWTEVGKPQTSDEEFYTSIDPMKDKTYVKILEKLQGFHKELIGMRKNKEHNPVRLRELQTDMRLHCNRLYIYMNQYIDVIGDLTEQHAKAREAAYLGAIANKKSDSAAEKVASESTRVRGTMVKLAELRLKQIDNNYRRYDGIVISLASELKGINSEMMLG